MSDELLENIDTSEGQPSGKAGGFEGLVERLALLAKQAEDATAHAGTWDWLTLRGAGIRAVLAELAKMGAETLPESKIANLVYEQCGDNEVAENAAASIVQRYGPRIAAKDADLARQAEEIERLRAEAMPTDEQLAEEAARFAYGFDWWGGATEEQRDRATRAALYVIRGGDDRSVFGAEVWLYAKGARRVGRPAARPIATEAPSMNITHPDD